MADSNFNIFFEGSEGGESTPANPADSGKPDSSNPTKSKNGIKQVAALATMQQIGKTALSYATSHVAMYTGSSDAQDKVNGVMSVAGTVGAIIANPALGIAMTALNLATKALDFAYKKTWESKKTEQNIIRAGPSFNKSRII